MKIKWLLILIGILAGLTMACSVPVLAPASLAADFSPQKFDVIDRTTTLADGVVMTVTLLEPIRDRDYETWIHIKIGDEEKEVDPNRSTSIGGYKIVYYGDLTYFTVECP